MKMLQIIAVGIVKNRIHFVEFFKISFCVFWLFCAFVNFGNAALAADIPTIERRK